jgi:hypothetical protein
MSRYYRVFGTAETEPAPVALLEYARDCGLEVVSRFRGDDQGWFAADLVLADETAPVRLERFLVSEEGIRAELNTWAAWLETAGHNPNHGWLMEHMILTRQIFTLESSSPDLERTLEEDLCLSLCQFLARAMAGVYQVDGQGFFAADGTLLVREEE